MPDTDIELPPPLGIYANGSSAAPFNPDTPKEARRLKDLRPRSSD